VSDLAQVLAGCAELLVGPRSRAAVLLLIDGLGARQLRDFATAAPTLAAMQPFASVVQDRQVGGRTVFPSTTATALASLGTGLDPGEHGLVGTAFWVPEIDQALFPLKWGTEPNPMMIQPEPTVFEAMGRAGVDVVSVGPQAYRASGLTQAALRGGRYLVAESAQERLDVIAEALRVATSTFIYCYWPRLDRVGHEQGVGSPEWLAALTEVDGIAAGILNCLGPDQHLVVTADHGMVNCPPDRRILIEGRPMLVNGVARVLGDPRARHLYVHTGRGTVAGLAADVAARWRDELTGVATVATRMEAVEQGWFGRVDPLLADRIGDVVAVCDQDWMLSSRTDPTVSRLVGQHGGMTPDEMQIPILHARG
jgi:hypothetical protein